MGYRVMVWNTPRDDIEYKSVFSNMQAAKMNIKRFYKDAYYAKITDTKKRKTVMQYQFGKFHKGETIGL